MMPPVSPEFMGWVLVILQVVWGLFLIILGWAIHRVLKDVEANTSATNKVAESVNALNVLLAGQYTTRPDMDRALTRVSELERDVTALQTRLDHPTTKRRQG